MVDFMAQDLVVDGGPIRYFELGKGPSQVQFPATFD